MAVMCMSDCRSFATALCSVGITLCCFFVDQWHKYGDLGPIHRFIFLVISFPQLASAVDLVELHLDHVRKEVVQRLLAKGKTELLQPLQILAFCDVCLTTPESIDADVTRLLQPLSMEDPAFRFQYRQLCLTDRVVLAGKRPREDELNTHMVTRLHMSTPAALEFVVELVALLEMHESEGSVNNQVMAANSMYSRAKQMVPRRAMCAIFIALQMATFLLLVFSRLGHTSISPMEAIAAFYAVNILKSQVRRLAMKMPHVPRRALIIHLEPQLWQSVVRPSILKNMPFNHALPPKLHKLKINLALPLYTMFVLSIYWYLIGSIGAALAGLLFAAGIGTAIFWRAQYLEGGKSSPFLLLAQNVLMHSALVLGIIVTANQWSSSGFNFPTPIISILLQGF